MNRINEINLEPGTYMDANERVVVVLDFITHKHNAGVDLVEALADPEIVVRPLISSNSEHVRESYPVSVFKSKFIKI